jgi:hypothetical protein
MRQRGSSNGPSTTSFLRQTSNANVFFLRAFSNHIELRAECRNLSELPGGQPTPGAGPKSYSALNQVPLRYLLAATFPTPIEQPT